MRAVASLAVAFVLTACSGGTNPSSSSALPTAAGPRPSSPASITILERTAGTTVSGTTLHVVLSLTGARIVSTTTTNIRPDRGHVHLYVDNNLVSMNYGLEQDITVQPGTYVLKAEFVAADHAPFNPRVFSSQVFFTVN
jgi:hypothetical protein